MSGRQNLDPWKNLALRRPKLCIVRFRASTKSSLTPLFLLSPKSPLTFRGAILPFRFLRFCQSVKLALCRTFDFAVLPECCSCPRISLRRRFAHVIEKSYLIRTVIQFRGCTIVVARFGQTKRADYTEHQKSAGAWLSLQNDVLCNRL